MKRSFANQNHRERASLLFVIALVSVLLWQTYIGSIVLYPFTILATWFHEMGHGVGAMLTGSGFEKLEIFSDGSGLATSQRSSDGYRVTGAFIAASGPLGPAIAGSLLIIASRSAETTRTALTVLGTALIVSTIIWVRTLIGWIILPVLGLGILMLALRGSPRWQSFGIQLLGVQACISVWRQFDYLFSDGGNVGGMARRSDTAAIADLLLLPYWFWGAVISAVTLVLLWWSFRIAFRR